MKTTTAMWALTGLMVVGWVATGCARRGGGSHFGEAFTDVPTVSIAQLDKTPEAFVRKPVRVKGTIERQCPASGCWFFLNDGQGRSIKVELGDYLPKLPQNVGNGAEVEGEWIRKGDHHEFIGTRVEFSGRGGGQ